MMIYVIEAIALVLAFIFLTRMSANMGKDHLFRGFVCLISFIICVTMFMVCAAQSVNYIDYKCNEPARQEWRIEERTVLTTLLGEMGTLIENDVTASSTYYDIYDKILEFNKEVRQANTWGGTIWEGLLCDPSYQDLDIIPLN